MSDFTSSFWSFYVAAIVLLGIVFNLWLLIANGRVGTSSGGAQNNTTGHVWDEDLCEYNNPLPRWWVGLFIITCVFGLVYLALYPGLGSYKGLLGWTSHKQFDAEMQQGEEQIAPIYAAFAGKTTQQLAQDPQAMAIGDRLFMNNCAQCHGSDAQGAVGFPNLTDKDWIWGGTPEAIHETITNGRMGIMPPQGPTVGTPDDVRNVANYVLGLAGQPHDAVRAAQGEAKFKMICAACHGQDGKGNQMLGAPNLTAAPSAWFLGPPTEDFIVQQINEGKTSVMPVWGKKFTPAQLDILTAYVWSRGGGVEPAAPAAAAPASAAAPAATDAAASSASGTAQGS
ncbi:MAG: cytochrome-c oxidase, cbb3-type subunit III [Burkholderiaceae bacterium]|jgi:cytochrome c oxidase cbb3-type subunit 3|nr:cytochrome-c oxidase, cbb3-type subunit III [Burkholderiaceae bacterium]